MLFKQIKCLATILIIIGLFACTSTSKGNNGDIYFEDDFETGLEKWDLVNVDKIKIVDSGDPEHGKAHGAGQHPPASPG